MPLTQVSKPIRHEPIRHHSRTAGKVNFSSRLVLLLLRVAHSHCTQAMKDMKILKASTRASTLLPFGGEVGALCVADAGKRSSASGLRFKFKIWCAVPEARSHGNAGL